MATTAPAQPLPITTPVSISPSPPAGWRSSEAWLTLIAMLLGALPSSGLIANSPIAAKLVGMALAALAALGYTANRTSLKRAHLVAFTTSQSGAAPVNSNKTSIAATAAAAIALVALVAFGLRNEPSAAARPVWRPEPTHATPATLPQPEGLNYNDDLNKIRNSRITPVGGAR